MNVPADGARAEHGGRRAVESANQELRLTLEHGHYVLVVTLLNRLHYQIAGLCQSAEEDERLGRSESGEVGTGLAEHFAGEVVNLLGKLVALAGVYAVSPQVYVLDEPSSNLDMQAIERVRKILSLLKRQGKTILIAEHRTYYLKELADRAIHMENGKIVREYTMEQLAHLSREEQLRCGIRTVDLLSCPVTPHTAVPAGHEIALKYVRCSYGKTEVLSIPGLSLASGRITAIIGANGAGKSTFVSWLCGLMKRSKGTFLLDGKRRRARDRVREGYLVMQEVNHQLFSDSVREEIALGSSRSTEDSLQKIMALLDFPNWRSAIP